jgi:hypothetical protein
MYNVVNCGQFVFLAAKCILKNSDKLLTVYFLLALAGLASGGDLDVVADLVVGPLLIIALLVVPVTDVDVIAAAMFGIGHGPGWTNLD